MAEDNPEENPYSIVLDFWFSSPSSPSYLHPKPFWYSTTPADDALVRTHLSPLYESAKSNALDSWITEGTGLGALALIILLDQVPRNIFCDTPQAYATDGKAVAVARYASTMPVNESETSVPLKPVPAVTPKTAAETTTTSPPGPEPRRPIPLEHLDNTSRYIGCPFCEHEGWTKIVQTHSQETKTTACICCFCIGVFGVWMPFVFRWYQNCQHLCSHCGEEVAFKPYEKPVQVRRPVKQEYMPPGPLKPV